MTPQDLLAEMLRAVEAGGLDSDIARECYYFAINYAREQREAETERLMGREFADRAYGREQRV